MIMSSPKRHLAVISGLEKFIDIKCRASGLMPNAVVLVATLRGAQNARWRRQSGGGKTSAR